MKNKRNEVRTVCYDQDLNIDAYHFEGIMQKFPNHFHDYYVIGFIEKGSRYLLCNQQEYQVNSGDVVIFHPRDTHTCEPVSGKTLDYRCINIQPETMRQSVMEITGEETLPRFTQNVIYHSEIASSLRELHLMIMEGERDFKKEERYYFLLEQLITEYADPFAYSISQNSAAAEPSTIVRSLCEYLEKNYAKTISLSDLSSLAGLSKYHLLRSFTKEMGISPYCYLETVRIENAKKLLEKDMPSIEVAYQTGFSDQSHFTNYFKRLIGITPNQYRKIFADKGKNI
ncbi:helix-turn-helix domain-containing protein [Sinanaerobacter chloroacetimidivorans]|uniref:AraC family transcriptional regulator n=1 Tax=Sinanaerobacter chloroacetimidivorans TaxID=2818044 RepID=A0A8J8B0J1_9FIRM|nr:AraC family transcriptional regulator [Sinanaerobacter chloroacetimidivorans]MBR0596842.1 AraC family transcriptional regulator [Sinanaerobacter chloroacetimidivorans]